MTLGATAAEPKRVLIVHSFGSAAPPFTTHSIAFETELTEKLGERVDLDEISLDMARYVRPEMQEALVDYIHKRQAKWQPDLVVPIGSPACVFVAQYRDHLFPGTPILYTGSDLRRLPEGALTNNAAFVGENFDLPGMVEDMLQVAPATTNIAVVIGASPLEQFWAAAFRKEFAPFTNRVGFTWLNDLSFDEMLGRVSQLPPHSYIFFILLLRDATGVTHNADEAIKQIHAVANAPMNSIFQHQLGLGIVGGRLYQAELEGVESARIAIRILHGEPASAFPPRIVRPLPPQYDWRELQRWSLNETQLPAGSSIRFRQPGFWELYRLQLVAVGLFCFLQTGLIIVLLANQTKRQRAEQALEEARAQAMAIVDSTNDLIWSVDPDRFGLLTWNRALRDHFFNRHNLELSAGLTPEELLPPAAAARWREFYTRALREGSLAAEYETSAQKSILLLSLHVLKRGSYVFGISVFGKDITERKQAEADSQWHREELAHVARVSTMGELAASVAHELNQPLGAILSNAEAAEMFLEQDPPAINELHAILVDIRKDDERAGEVIRRLRSLLRKHELERQPLSLNSLVEDVLRLVSADAALRKTAIAAELSPHLPTVLGDRIHLQQVLLNLIMNAIDALAKQPPGKRQLVVRTSRSANNTVEASVSDSGPGIEPDQLSRIFEPFFTTKPNGIGMGLSISRKIVEAHHGELRAENLPSGGAIFRMTLPAAEEKGNQ